MPSLAGGFTVSNGDIATASYLNTWFGTGTLSFSSGKTLLGNSTLGATTFQEIPLSSNLSFSANSAGSALGIADSPTITGPTTISQATGGGPPSLTISGNGAGPIVETIKNTLAGASSYAQLRIFNDSSQGPILAVNSSAYSGSGFGGLASTGYLSMGGNYSFQIGAKTLTFYSGSSLTQSLLIDASNAATFYGTATVTGLLTASGGITGSIGQTTAAAGSFTTLSASGTLALGSQTGDNILIHGTVGYNWINFEEGSASKFSMGPFNTGHFQIYSTNGLNANVLDITGSSGLVTVPYNLGVSGTSTLTGNVTVGTLGSGNVSNSVLIQGSSANGYGPFVQFVDGTGSMGAVGSSNSWGTGNARGMAFAATNALQFLTNNGTLALTLDTSQNATFAGQVIVHDATFHRTLTTMTNGAASNTGTLTNAPVAGNPTKWVPVNDNGTTRYVPMW